MTDKPILQMASDIKHQCDELTTPNFDQVLNDMFSNFIPGEST